MAQLDWRRASLAGKPTLNLKDERERLDRGFTSRWLADAEKRLAMKQAKARRRNRTHKK